MFSRYKDRDKLFTSTSSCSPHEPRDEKSCMSSFWNWQPEPTGLGVQLLQESNIHGMKYIAQPDRHIIERIFWVIILSLSFGGAIYMSYNAVTKFIQSPVIISFQPVQTLVSQTPFPAITICSINRLKKSAFEKALKTVQEGCALNQTNEDIQEARFVLKAFDHICSSSDSFSVKFNYSLNETTVNLCNRGLGVPCKQNDNKGRITVNQRLGKKLMEAFHNSLMTCEEMIRLCLWKGKPVACGKFFTALITDLGRCCTFNMMPFVLLTQKSVVDENVEHHNNQYRQNLTAKEIKAWKEFNIDDTLMNTGSGKGTSNTKRMPYLKYESDAGQNSGLSVVLNPELNEYFCSSHNGYGFRVYAHSPIEFPHVLDYGIAVPPNVEMFMSVQVELTIAESSARWVSIDKRQCYYVGEKPLNSFTQYTLSNCIDECIAEEVIKQCNCARLEMPQALTHPNMTYCEGNKFHCSERVKQMIANNGTKKQCPDCLQSCSRIQYSSKTSSLPIRNDAKIWLKSGKNASWAGDNVTVLNVFFGSDVANSRVRKRLFGFTELFGQVGGILGLFLGFSVISLVEPFYYIFRVVHDRAFKRNEPRFEKLSHKSEETLQCKDNGRSGRWGRKSGTKVEDFGGQYLKKLTKNPKIDPPGGFPFLN